MRKAEIRIFDRRAGWLTQDENGCHFEYDSAYLQSANPQAISMTRPLKVGVYTSNVLFPFFDGLIPEGWLLEIAEKNWKLNVRARMGLLLACCKNCIGAVSVHSITENNQ